MQHVPSRRRRRLLASAVTLGALGLATVATAPASAQAPPACPWMDTTKSPTQRAQLLLAASSLDQKLRWLDEQSANNPTQTVFIIGGGQTTTMPPQVPCTPVIQYTDAPSAIVGAGTGVTAFPVQVGLSATWDEALARRKAKAQGYEAFNKRGDVNPAGRLTHSFPRSEADLPTAGSPRQYPGVFSDGGTTRPPGSTEIRQVDYLEGLKVGYRWYDAERIKPLFAFGHGLSYTKFDYGRLHAGPLLLKAGRSLHATFRVTNTGSRTGTEIAQVYLSLPSRTGEPPKRLVGWERVTLAPGRSRTVNIEIDPDSPDHPFSYWDGRWRIASGLYKVSVGRSAADLEDSEPVLVIG